MTDADLLRRFAGDGSEADFTELVRRHVNLVYSVALRQVNGDVHLAQDVTQAVFTDLARKAADVAGHRALAGWLFTSTRFAAAKAVRTEQRRQAREQEAQTMQDMLQDDPAAQLDWARVRPVLDDALGELKDEDREAILLRFFEGRNFAEVGRTLELTDNAARMRVERALDRLRSLLERRGIASTASALAAALASQAVIAAPAGLAAAAAGAALASGMGTAAVAAAAATGFMSITKLQLGLAGAVAVAGATSYVVQAQQREQLQAELEQLRTQETAITVLRQENEQLSREAVEASDLRRDDAELARLRDEADALRVKLLAAARSQDANATIYEVNQLDQLPAPSTRVPPVYPTEMREAGIGGEVLVDFIVDVNGEVKNAFAKKSTHREFEAAAVEAVSKWVFRAGRKNGRQINTHMQVPIVFSPRSGAESGTPQPVPNPNGWF